MDWALTLNDRAVWLLLGALHVLLDHADTFDEDLILGTDDLKDLSLGTTVVSGDDLHDIAGMNVGFDKLSSRHVLNNN